MGIFINKNSQKGQILLIVVLAAVVSLTVGLAAVSRSITNTKVTTEEASSQKALSAAEAGAEQLAADHSVLVLKNKPLSNNSKFDARASQVLSTDVLVNGGNEVLKDDGADVWLSTYPFFTAPQWSGTLTVNWKNGSGAGTCDTKDSAIEIVVISGTDKNNPSMTRAVYDACGSRRTVNNFSNPGNGGSVQGVLFDHNFQIVINNGFIARIIPLYANTIIGVNGSVQLPSQGYIIDSVGTSGNTTRKVRVFQGYSRVPIEYFPYNLFLP